MARTGLRMMPTFPSPPLKFRTAGFPQYGFKASLSDRACRRDPPVKSVPDIPGGPRRWHLSFAGFGHHIPSGSESRLAGASACRCARGRPSRPQGSLAPIRVLLSRTLIAYYDPIRQSRGHATTSRPSRLYVAPSLCGHASATRETFPTFTAVLSTRAADPTPVGLQGRPVARAPRSTRLPRSVTESPPTTTVSASNTRRVFNFGAASFALCYGPRVCQALLTGYGQMGSRALHRAFSGPRHSRFRPRSSPGAAGSQARWANGKSPIVGTCTRHVTAASEAAQPNENTN